MWLNDLSLKSLPFTFPDICIPKRISCVCFRHAHDNGVEEAENDFMIWGIWVNERVYLTKDRIQPFLTGGLGFIQTRTELAANVPAPSDPLASVRTAWGFSALLGVGAEIYWTENFITTVGINYYFTTGGIADHDFATAGIGFQFF